MGMRGRIVRISRSVAMQGGGRSLFEARRSNRIVAAQLALRPNNQNFTTRFQAVAVTCYHFASRFG